MAKPYDIKQPITDLASLRREKVRLKMHIEKSDRQLRERIQKQPLLIALKAAGNVASFVGKSKFGGVANGVVGKLLTGKKQDSFLPELVKAAALFAAGKLTAQFLKRKQRKQQENEMPDLAE